MSKRIIKELSGMSIDEVSLVDRGANQHALISFAKSANGVNALFEKARGGGVTDSTKTASPLKVVEEHHGDDPASVVDEFVANDKKGDVGPGKTISGTEKKSAKNVNGKSAPAGSGKGGSGGGSKEVDTSISESDEDDDSVLAKALGLVLDELTDDIEKGFGPPSPFGQQQPQPPQFGAPPAMQSVGAMPMGMGAPQAPAPGVPGMAGAMPGAMPGMPGAMPPQMPGQGAPAQLGMAQLPPEAIAYIQQLEAKLAKLQGNGSDSGGEQKPESSDSSSGGSDSDNSNKPFGKSGDFNVDGNAFLEELSKAIRDEDRGEFSKALQARFEAYETEVSKAQEIAKAERDLRLEREFIAKAAEFDVPVAPDQLGPVLKRAAENLSEEDFGVIVKCLDAATEVAQEIYGEIGKRGMGANSDVLSQVSAEAEELAKNGGPSGAEAVAAIFESNPAAYDEYLANRRGLGR